MSNKNDHEITGKLSSRIMNMKFMKHAEQAEEQKEATDTDKKLVHASEWRIYESTESLKKQLSRRRVNHALGFSAMKNINQEFGLETQETSNPGRRTFGKKAGQPCKDADNAADNGNKRLLENDDISNDDLDKLWAAEKASKHGHKDKRQKKTKTK